METKSIKSVTGKEVPISSKYEEASSSNPDLATNYCKVCGEKGRRVLQVTAATHIDSKYWNLLADGFRFSYTKDCPVIYFNNNTGTYFLKDEVKTRFGLKESEDPRPICYCLAINEEHIRYEILKKSCCDSLEDIVEYTKAGTGKWCLTTNPSGKCCKEYLPEIVDKYLGMNEAKVVHKDLQKVKEDMTEEIVKKVVMKVDGMTCEGCSSGVCSIIENAGGKDVKVSFKDGTAELSAKADLQPDEITKAIEDGGYGAKVLKVERIR